MRRIILLLILFVSLTISAQNNNYNIEEQKLEGYIVELEKLHETMISVKKLETLMAEFEKIPQETLQDREVLETYQSRYDEVFKEMTIEYIDYIKVNPSSMLSLLIAADLFEQIDNAYSYEELLDVLSPELLENEIGTSLIQKNNDRKKTSIGSIAPNFTLDNVNGESVSLSDFRGKYVLIDFWASWCRPCRKENPYLVQAYEKFKDKNFEIIGVSLDNPGGKLNWVNAIEKDELTWIQVSDLKGWQSSAAIEYKVLSIPQNFLIDPDGIIIAKNLRGNELEKVLTRVVCFAQDKN
ncbi:peroxiredoxin [Dysgonomonadaceae bacterium PH5-43]|nr:peroxiredoxin [Dysgonomonadaceae bacterium PH5-43]